MVKALVSHKPIQIMRCLGNANQNIQYGIIMKKIILVLSILLFTPLSFANSTSGDHQLHQIMKDFETAVTTKDKAKFFNLFYEGAVSWVGVSSSHDYNKNKKRVEKTIAKGERAMPPMKTYPGDNKHFFEMIISPTKSPKMTFSNVKVQHDGDVASIYLDYEFYAGEVKSAWGKKSFLLVNTQSGWKINSVIFSISQ